MAVALAALAPAAASAATTITTIAGNGVAGGSGDGGQATAAAINHPRGFAAMADGSFIFADAFDYRIRRVFPNGTIRTVAGTGVKGYSGDGGAATSARLNLPHAVAAMPDGGFLISDEGNNRIRQVFANGTIRTVAGTGIAGFSGDGGPALTARVAAPRGLATLGDGSYLIADSDNNRVRLVSTSGIITTVAGIGTSAFGGDGGAAKNAGLNSPWGVEPLVGGGYLITDTDNHRIRRVSASGIINTVAGNGFNGSAGDGGPATSASLGPPYNTAALASGAVLIADPNNNRVRQVSAGGIMSTAAGSGVKGFSGDGGSPTSARLSAPKAVLGYGSGFLIADSENHRVRRVQSCTDHSAPVSYYSRGTGRTKRRGKRLKIGGTVAEKGCSGVAKVAISVARIQGKRCRQLGSRSLGRTMSCSKRKFLKAKVKSRGSGRYRWSFASKHGLPRGRYIALVRSVDHARNLERRKQAHGTRRNVVRFKIG